MSEYQKQWIKRKCLWFAWHMDVVVRPPLMVTMAHARKSQQSKRWNLQWTQPYRAGQKGSANLGLEHLALFNNCCLVRLLFAD